MSQQLVKKGANGRIVNVNPRSWIEAIKDKNTGQTLVEILQGFNMYFLPYNGNTSSTRCLVPTMLRKKGLWITYVKYDGNVYTEWYAADKIDDKSWGDSSNWRIGNNTLVGDITISANGNWVINGTETEFKAVGEKGNTPLIRVANNRLQVSYDLGDTYMNVTENPVYTKFRWLATSGDTQANNVGKIQASNDEGKTWTNMSNDFTNNLHISRYIGVSESLPTSGIAEGTIYAKGPYYAEDDALNDNPIYRLWVYAWKGDTLAWQDNGEFTSIAAGIVQETGDSETEVMSQKAVSEKLSELGSEIRKGIAYNLGNDLVFFKNKLSSISSIDNYSALIDSEDYDCFLIKVKEGVDIKVSGAVPAQYVFYSEFPAEGTNVGYLKYNTSGKYVENSKYAVINFRHSENESGYGNIEINTDYKIKEVEYNLSWKVIYVELSSRIASEINALPEGSYFLNTYSNTLGVRTGESGWIDHPFSKNELYIIDDKPYCFNGSEIKLLRGKDGGVDLSDKKWVCFGDSLTEVNSRATKRYYDYISDKTGINIVNMGLGGTGYKDEEDNNNAFYQRILNVPTDSDLITIFGSGNDLSHTLGNVTDTNTDTICGCINKTLDNLFDVYPLANVGIITPTPWGWYPPTDDENKMAKYSNSLVEICRRRGIPCLDLYHCSGLRPWEESYLSLCYSKDNGNSVHPDENGHKIIASKIQHFVESLLLH